VSAGVEAGSRHEGATLPGVWLVTLPFSTPLSLNDRMHHMARARLNVQWKAATVQALQEAGVPKMELCSLTMFYVPRYRRRHDEDNLVASMKPIADGVVAAGIVPDDTREFMHRNWPIFCNPDSKRTEGRILVQLEQLR